MIARGLHLPKSLAGRLLRWQPGEASLIGWLLQTKALIMIIFANILLDRQIISADTFTALLLMAVAFGKPIAEFQAVQFQIARMARM